MKLQEKSYTYLIDALLSRLNLNQGELTRSKTWYILSFAEPMAQWTSSTVTDGDRLAKTSGC
ncbi:MAG: hypothetical protein WCO45_16975 [Pseudanabaena sp. ELA607]